MFKKTSSTSQMNLFSSPEGFLGKRALKSYSDPKSWHNQFFELVTSKIDEEIFSVLYKKGNMGAPTASVRVLVAMSILKEGFGCSDENLFEKVEFDLLVRKALGLVNLDDTPPSLDTYYLFNRRLCDYHETTGIDLMEKCFEQVTGGQIRKFDISGKSVRMDSKLIGSNIARYSRYEIVLTTFQKLLSAGDSMSALNPSLRKKVEPYMEEKGSHTVYTSDATSLSARITALGNIVYQTLKRLDESASGYALMHRVFHEQYRLEAGAVILRDKKEIKSDSVQNPNDPDAHYRDKRTQKVQGYSVNITETIEDGKPSLITSVQTEGASMADCHYVPEAIEKTERVTGHTVEVLYADGAYQSPDNRSFASGHLNPQGNPMSIKTGRMQGGPRFILKPIADSKDIEVIDTRTGQVMTGIWISKTPRRGNRWRIKISDGDWRAKPFRYFEQKDFDASQLRQEIESLPVEEQHRRNNVEAAMFQYSFHSRNNKTRYRGRYKHRLHALRRCAWMNMRRLMIYMAGMTPEDLRVFVSSLPESILTSINAIYRRIIAHADFFKNLGRGICEAFSDHKSPLVTNVMLNNATF